MDQESFLARVRKSVDQGRGDPPPEPGRNPPPSPPSASSTQERTERLVSELVRADAVVYRVASSAEAREAVLGIVRERGVRRLVRDAASIVEELDLDAELKTAGIAVTVAEVESPEGLRQAELDADAGLTGADFGVAESGTLALLARPGQGRCVSLLPPIHLAVLDARRIVDDLGALFAAVTAAAELPSALTLITGPSRTADIELVLTIGVHGPKELHLVLIG